MMIPQLSHLNRHERRAAILFMEQENGKFPDRLTEIPRDRWPSPRGITLIPIRVLRSKEFMVMVYEEADGVLRLSVNRSHVDPQTLRWVDGITWDELQVLKGEAGYGNREAVEVYPPDSDVVNVGSLRHLWVLPERMPFSWARDPAALRSDDLLADELAPGF